MKVVAEGMGLGSNVRSRFTTVPRKGENTLCRFRGGECVSPPRMNSDEVHVPERGDLEVRRRQCTDQGITFGAAIDVEFQNNISV